MINLGTPSAMVQNILNYNSSIDLSSALVVSATNKQLGAFFGFSRSYALGGKVRHHKQGITYKAGEWEQLTHYDHTATGDGMVTDAPSVAKMSLGKEEVLFCVKGVYDCMTSVAAATDGLKPIEYNTDPFNVTVRKATFADIKPLLDAMKATKHRVNLKLNDFPMTSELKQALVELATIKGAKLTLELSNGLDAILDAAEERRRFERVKIQEIAAEFDAVKGEYNALVDQHIPQAKKEMSEFKAHVAEVEKQYDEMIAVKDAEIQALKADKASLIKEISEQNITIQPLAKANQVLRKSVVASEVAPVTKVAVTPVAKAAVAFEVVEPVAKAAVETAELVPARKSVLAQFEKEQAQNSKPLLAAIAEEEMEVTSAPMSPRAAVDPASNAAAAVEAETAALDGWEDMANDAEVPSSSSPGSAFTIG